VCYGLKINTVISSDWICDSASFKESESCSFSSLLSIRSSLRAFSDSTSCPANTEYCACNSSTVLKAVCNCSFNVLHNYFTEIKTEFIIYTQNEKFNSFELTFDFFIRSASSSRTFLSARPDEAVCDESSAVNSTILLMRS